MVEARYDRLHTTIVKYYQHCKEHKAYVMAGIAKLLNFGVGTEESYDILAPVLSTQHGYNDYEPPSVPVLSSIYQRSCSNDIEIWNSYTQQLTGQHVSIDATHKIAKKVNNGSYTRLWSMVDIETGCILHQQMLTHEAHEDVLPMFKQYATRCRELQRPLPVRVCSDRGLMDANIIRV